MYRRCHVKEGRKVGDPVMTHRMVPGKEWCHRHRKGRQADSHQGTHAGNFTSSYNEADFKSELKKSADLALG